MITLAQHLAAHWLWNSITDDTDHDDNDWSTYCQCGYRIAATTAADIEAAHREHVAATWQQARTITTLEVSELRPGGGPGSPVGTAHPDHQPIVPMAAGIPPRCTCGVVGGNGSGRPGDRPLLADHLRQVDPSYGSRP